MIIYQYIIDDEDQGLMLIKEWRWVVFLVNLPVYLSLELSMHLPEVRGLRSSGAKQ